VDEGAELFEALRGFGKELGATLEEEHELREITEGGGATGGDTLGVKSVEDHVESPINTLFRKSFSFQVRQVLRQIVFPLDGAVFYGGVGAAIAFERIERAVPVGQVSRTPETPESQVCGCSRS
jgi:hypothetical protein